MRNTVKAGLARVFGPATHGDFVGVRPTRDYADAMRAKPVSGRVPCALEGCLQDAVMYQPLWLDGNNHNVPFCTKHGLDITLGMAVNVSIEGKTTPPPQRSHISRVIGSGGDGGTCHTSVYRNVDYGSDSYAVEHAAPVVDDAGTTASGSWGDSSSSSSDSGSSCGDSGGDGGGGGD